MCVIIIFSIWIDICFVVSSKIHEICLSEFNVYFLNTLLILADTFVQCYQCCMPVKEE
jgi:hypothetical protein